MLEGEKKALKDEVVYLQSQSMRNNLVFSNIPEADSESNETTETKLREFITEKMKIAKDEVDKIAFERVHRMDIRRRQGNRNIVAKFHEYKDREYVRKQAKVLKDTNFYVNEQFPKEIVDKRRRLVPKMKEARRQGKSSWISYDTLYIEGKAVRE